MQVEVGSWLDGLTPLFAAAAETVSKTGAKPGESPFAAPDFGLFDVLLILAVGLGAWRGKVRGISEELLDFFQWLVIVVAAGYGYEFVGGWLAGAGLPPLYAHMGGYVLLIIAVSLLFGAIKKSVGNKLVDSDFFGGWEYRLGMLAGAIRYACIFLCLLALLHARYFDAELVKAERNAQQKEVGIVILPSWGILNRMAFYESLSGPYIREYLSHQLIAPVGLTHKAPNANSLGKREQRVLDEVTAPPKPVPAPTSPPADKKD